MKEAENCYRTMKREFGTIALGAGWVLKKSFVLGSVREGE